MAAVMDYMVAYRTESEAEFPGLGAFVQVAKVGGGTVGKRYDGHWIINLYEDGNGDLLESIYWHSGVPKTHAEVAREVCEEYLEYAED